MSSRVEGPRWRPLGIVAVLVGSGWLASGCSARHPPLTRLDDAPIRVKNQRLDVEITSSDPQDVWEPDGSGEYQSKKNSAQLWVIVTKSDNSWCAGQPFPSKFVDIEYGVPGTLVTSATIHIGGSGKFKAKFRGKQPNGVHTKILYVEGASTDFLYRVYSKNGSVEFECKTTPSIPMVTFVYR